MVKSKPVNTQQIIDAINKSSIGALQALLDGGADPNSNLDSKHYGNLGLLAVAAGCQFVEGVEALLKAGADVNYCSNSLPTGSGRTALYEAIMGEDARPSNAPNRSTEPDRIKLVDMLLKAGANPNIVGDGDRLPLSAAALTARYEVVQRLIEAGATYKTWPIKCSPPLVAAAGGGPHADEARKAAQEQICRLLLKLGAPLDGEPETFTPLMAAALSGNEFLAGLFLEYGAQVNRKEMKHGRTPLICAALYYRWNDLAEAKRQVGLRIMKRLLEAGADPSIRNGRGETAFDVVSKCTDFTAANLIKDLAGLP